MPRSSKKNDKKQNAGRRRIISRAHATMVSRFGLIFALSSIIAFAIASKLIATTTVHADAWNRMAASTLRDSVLITPQRGEILASDGSILATNLCYFNVRMDMRATSFDIITLTDTIDALCDSLAAVTKHSSKYWKERFAKALEPDKDHRTRNFVIANAVPEETVKRIKQFPFFSAHKSSNYTGLKVEEIIKRSYPFGRMARLSIGRVGALAENPDVRGRSGLERALDTLLYGVAGLKRNTLSTRGVRYAEEIPAQNGFDVTTTIDITIQDILEDELGQMLIDAHADWGTAMIMEVATGDIVAISNLERDSTSRTPRYVEALNRVVQAYEPGSVMKVMSMAVALEKGYALPVSKTYSIGSSYAYAGDRRISDTHSPGTLPVSRFLEYSSNIGMVKLMMPHYESNPNQFKADLAELGFFDRFNTGIAREVRPIFHSLKHNKQGRVALSRMVFGYATMIPPLYTCAFYNAVANGGKFVRPRLVKSLRFPDGRDSIIPVSYVREQMMSEQNAALLRKMMRDVVWEQGGTAKALKSDIVDIAGKTGTCKIALEDKRPKFDKDGNPINRTPFKGGYLEGRYRVTFCGFFPYENPKYTCIVVINDPKVPYRGPAVSSGIVLKNVALKLFARGKLESDPVFDEKPVNGKGPTVYSSFNTQRNSILHSDLHLSGAKAIRTPAGAKGSGIVPDVRGVSIREALACLEGAGYAVNFTGVGYVESQVPAPGTAASPGTKVRLTLRHD
ncbi:MAG: transpeptidase family protein [Bacteroidales bacterium]|nr:transpeptidase family protein [Bacteroidales bacterium]